MSAYVIIEASVVDEGSRDSYSSKVGPILKEFGGEVLGSGPWQTLFGEPAFDNGMVIRFANKEAALSWYHSAAYQALMPLRNAALDCRFRLVG
jgi:uncharacterized protein (DUF1330 family)